MVFPSWSSAKDGPQVSYSIHNIGFFKNFFREFHNEYTVSSFNQLSFMFWLTAILLVAIFINLFTRKRLLTFVTAIAPAMMISVGIRLYFLTHYLIRKYPRDPRYSFFANISILDLYVFSHFCLILLGLVIISFIYHDPHSSLSNSVYFLIIDLYVLHSLFRSHTAKAIETVIPSLAVGNLIVYVINLSLFIALLKAAIFLISTFFDESGYDDINNDGYGDINNYGNTKTKHTIYVTRSPSVPPVSRNEEMNCKKDPTSRQGMALETRFNTELNSSSGEVQKADIEVLGPAFNLESYTQDNEVLKSDLEALKADNEALRADIQVLAASNEELAAENQTLLIDNKTLKNKNEALLVDKFRTTFYSGRNFPNSKEARSPSWLSNQ